MSNSRTKDSTTQLDAAKVRAQLLEGSSQIKSLAAGLNARIIHFEEWIATVPGRVEASASAVAHDPHTPTAFVLGLHRVGKAWRLEYCYYNDEWSDPEDVKWSPVIDAGIDEKVSALNTLPKLFENLQNAQRAHIEKIREANEKFDAFAKAVGMTPKGDA